MEAPGFKGEEVIPEAIPAEALWLTGPHTFVRRNRSFSEVKNLATGLLINHLSKRRNSCPLKKKLTRIAYVW